MSKKPTTIPGDTALHDYIMENVFDIENTLEFCHDWLSAESIADEYHEKGTTRMNTLIYNQGGWLTADHTKYTGPSCADDSPAEVRAAIDNFVKRHFNVPEDEKDNRIYRLPVLWVAVRMKKLRLFISPKSAAGIFRVPVSWAAVAVKYAGMMK